MAEDYSSYVVRIRRRRNAPASLRIEVEDLLGGGRSTLEGPPARALSDGLTAAMERGAAPEAAGPGAATRAHDPGSSVKPIGEA